MARFDMNREVEWGEAQEGDILKRWLAGSPEFRADVRHVYRAPKMASYDFLLLDQRFGVLAYVEIKRRRLNWARYKDVLLPEIKRTFAIDYGAPDRPYLAVTEYDCGTIVEVNLTEALPVERPMVSRRDRGNDPVPHVLYAGDACRVIA